MRHSNPSDTSVGGSVMSSPTVVLSAALTGADHRNANRTAIDVRTETPRPNAHSRKESPKSSDVLCSRVRVRLRRLSGRCRRSPRHTRRGCGARFPTGTSGCCCISSPTPVLIVSKDGLIESAWSGLAVTDNSLEQAISGLRRVLGDGPDGRRIFRQSPGKAIDSAARSPERPPVPQTIRSTRCSRRIGRGLRARQRSRRSRPTRSCARAASSRACCAARRTRHRRTSASPTPASCNSR